MPIPTISLTTDFGGVDHYVAAMKAVMLRIAPNVRFIDISHEIPAQDIMAGAWVLKNSAFLFPPGTIHLAVVDPGVGSERRPIAAKIGGHFFVGPDNGLLSLIAEENISSVVVLENEAFFNSSRSNTFHGRDIFAPVAAHLASGVDINEFGSPLENMTTFRWARPIADKEGIQGWVVHIDRFGNLITNIPKELVKEVMGEDHFKIYVGNCILSNVVPTFSSVSDSEAAALFGSSGMLEIVVNKGDARQMLDVQKGAPVSLIFNRK